MKIFFKTYGCTLNKADTEKMKVISEKAGHAVVENEDEADVVVVNTCTVKGATESKIRYYLELLKKNDKPFVVAGCLSAVDKSLAEKYRTGILNPYSIKHIDEGIKAAINRESKVIFHFEDKNIVTHQKGPIAAIGIQDGCTSFCAFCQTKLARPKLQSQKIETILEEVENSVENGAVEVDLSGTDTGAYGLDVGTDLAELLDRVNDIDGKFMVRVGMANPHHIKRLSNKLVDAYKGKHIYKFLHTSVQSGSEKVVKDMRRDHTVKDFEDVVRLFRRAFNDITIETDIIVGYPTEDENDFEDTLKFLERVKPEVVNLSKFTPRKGTLAAKLKQLPTETIKKRSIIASALLRELHEKMNEDWVGKEIKVLITERAKAGFKGRTLGYKQAFLPIQNKKLLGKWVRCTVDNATHTTLVCSEKISEDAWQ